MSHSCFVHSATDRYLGCFCILGIVNNAAMNREGLMFFQISVLGSFGYIPRSGMAGSEGRSIINFLRCLHTAFHSDCASLHSHQRCRQVSLSPHLVSTCLLIIDDSYSVRCEIVSPRGFNLWWLVMLSVFIYLLAICMSSLQKFLFRTFAHFLTKLVFFGVEYYKFFMNFGY